jgi:steroid delta-isomerase-like uncharacterized protein
MTREQIVGIMQVMQRAWNAKDPTALAAVHSDDGVVHSPMFGEVRGRAEIERTYAEMFRTFEDWTWESGDLIIDGDRCAQLFTATATHSHEMFGVEATHRRFRVQGVLVFELRDGKIISERRLYDFTSLLIQVGVLKTKPGKGT